MNNHKELVDRLIVATEEQDVLWVLVMLEQMKESGCLEQAINASHSWKRYSALQAISRLSSLSILHRFIAQLLLFNGATSTENGQNAELSELAKRWKDGDRGEAQDAQHVLSLGLTEAADWIDSNLPLPPNPRSLTGDGPLPLPTPSSTRMTSRRSTPVSSSPSSHVETFERASLPIPKQRTRLLTLLLSGLPNHCAIEVIDALFGGIGVKTHHRTIGNRGFAFVQVAAENVRLCIDSFDRTTIYGNYHISCYLAESQPEDSQMPRSRSSSPPRRHRPRSPTLLSATDETFNRTDSPSVAQPYANCSQTPQRSRSRSARSLSPRRNPHSTSLRRRYEEEEVVSKDEPLHHPIGINAGDHRPRRYEWSDTRPPSPDFTTLHIAGLPLDCSFVWIKALFSDLDVITKNVVVRSKSDNRFAFVDVEDSQVRRCIRSIDGMLIQGHRISCYVSKPQKAQGRTTPTSRYVPDRRPQRSPPRSISTIHLSHLPLRFKQGQVRHLFDDIRIDPLAIRQANDRGGNESFAFVDVASEDVQSCIDRLDAQIIIGGVRLSCSLAKEPCRHRPSSSPFLPPIENLPRDPQSSTNFREEANNSSKYLTNLHVAGLPHQIHEVEVVQLFARFGIKLFGLRLAGLNSSRRSPYAFVEVETDQVRRCMNDVDGIRYKGYTISCYESNSTTVDPLPTPPSLP